MAWFPVADYQLAVSWQSIEQLGTSFGSVSLLSPMKIAGGHTHSARFLNQSQWPAKFANYFMWTLCLLLFFFFFRSPTSRRFHCPWWVLWICCTEFQSRKQKGHKRHLWAKKEKNYLGCLTMRKHDVQMHVNIALQFCGTCMCLWKDTYFCKNLSDHFLLLTRMCLCFLNFHLAAAIIHTPSHFSIFMLFLGRDRGFVMGSLLLWHVVTASPGFDQFI